MSLTLVPSFLSRPQKLLSNCVLDPTEVLQAMDLIEEAFVDDGEPIRIRTLMKLASDDALARTKIESALVEGFRPIDLKDRITLAEIHASGTLPGGVIEDESFHEVLQVSLLLLITFCLLKSPLVKAP